jgi:hypothetical protein
VTAASRNNDAARPARSRSCAYNGVACAVGTLAGVAVTKQMKQ